MLLNCKVLLPPNEALEDIGVESQDIWGDMVIDMTEIHIAYEFYNDRDEVEGTAVITKDGIQFIINEPFESVHKMMVKSRTIEEWKMIVEVSEN